MKLRHTIFNSIGLSLASIAGVGFLLHLFVLFTGHDYLSRAQPIRSLVELIGSAAIMLGVGGSALANMVNRRLMLNPTIVMIVIYFLTFVLMPMGVWGILELPLKEELRQRNAGKQKLRKLAPKEGSMIFYRFAQGSWIFFLAGFFLSLPAPYIPAGGLRNFLEASGVLCLLVALILGSVALIQRDKSKKDPLLPGLAGVSASGLFFLLVLIGHLCYQFTTPQKNHHAPALEVRGSSVTNTVSQAP